MQRGHFEKLLLESVDEGLSSVGETSKQLIYFHLKQQLNIDRAEIPQKIEVFEETIEKIFGSGADYLELLIMKHLQKKIGRNLCLDEEEKSPFSEKVATMKQIASGEVTCIS